MTPQFCALTATRTAADLVGLVKSHCAGHRALRAMSAWARVDGVVAEADVLGWVRGSQIHLPRLDEIVALRVADARRVAGVDTRALLDMFTRDYLVLRAPWLWYAAATGAVPGAVPLASVDFWRTVDPAPAEDAFAVDGQALKEHFRGIAVTL